MERVKQCLAALFSFSSIPKQQISPGRLHSCSAVQSGAGLPCSPCCSKGDPQGLPDTGGGFPASFPAVGMIWEQARGMPWPGSLRDLCLLILFLVFSRKEK